VSSSPGLLAQTLRVGPHAGSHRVALRACVSVLVPLLVLWGIGHQEWSIYAAFGAFTSLYGRNHVHLPRLAMQATMAVMLTGAVVLGVAVGLSEHRGWLAVPVAALVASGTCLVSDALDLHPPGSLFMVFAFAACASVPSEPADLVTAALLTGAGCLVAAALFALDLDGLALIAVVVALQAGAELWVGRNYAIALVAVTPLALLMVHLVAPVPASGLLVDRGGGDADRRGHRARRRLAGPGRRRIAARRNSGSAVSGSAHPLGS
jgi:hypothetical protein